MNLRALTFGCVIGLSLAVIPSCGGGGGGGTGGGSGSTTGGGTGSTTGGGTGSTTGGGSGSTTGGGSGSTTGGGSGSTTGGGTGSTTGGGTGSTTGGGTGSNTCQATAANTCTNTSDSCFPVSNTSNDGICVAGACHIAPSDCANATQNCVFVPGTNNQLTTICYAEGDGGIGAACGDARDCKRGFGCLGTGSGPAECTKWCYADGDCGAGGLCNTFVTFGLSDGGTFANGALACSFPTPCDPLAQGCGGGEGCYIVNVEADGGFQFGCETAGTIADGAACQGSTDCVAGSTCVPNNQQGTSFSCRKMCNADGGSPGCTTGMCTPASGSLGICL